GDCIMWRAVVRVVLAGVLAGLAGARPIAQTVTGSIAGVIHDQTDQTVPGATVTLVSDATGEGRTTVSTETGAFVFPAVRPGSYTVRVEMSGFSPLERRNTVLPAGETLTVGVLKLQVGGLSETGTLTPQGSLRAA